MGTRVGYLSKTCTVKLFSGERCNTKLALHDYPMHLRTHGIEIMNNTVENFIHIEDQTEHVMDTGNDCVNNAGLTCDKVLRRYYGMTLLDGSTKRLEFRDMTVEEFMDSFIPLISSVCRAWRDLRKEAKDYPELHKNWILSEHVAVKHTYQERAYRLFFKNRKAVEGL